MLFTCMTLKGCVFTELFIMSKFQSKRVNTLILMSTVFAGEWCVF